MMKNAFYFSLKFFFVPKKYKSLSWVLVQVEERIEYGLN